MSTTLEVQSPDSQAPGGVLVDRTPFCLRLPRVIPAFVALIGGLFWSYSYQRLHHTDLWGHLAYGRIICETSSLPATEPLMPLAEGVPLVDTAWLAQVLGYRVMAQWGPAGVQFLHAATIAACLALVAGGLYRRTHSFLFSVLGLGLFETLNWFQFQIVRPQMGGLVCFTLLTSLLTTRRWHKLHWVAIPTTLAIWANLHGSFIVGLVLLGCATIGRGVDVWRRTNRVSSMFRDRHARRLLLTTELAAAATLLNPYGLRLYAEVLSFSGNQNLQDLIEWNSLNFRSMQGQLAAGTALALAIVYRLSPRRVSAGELLALVVLGAAGMWSARMLIWWTPLAVACFVLHAHAAWRRFHPLVNFQPPVRSGKWAVVTVGLVWICFAWTPFGLHLLHGKTIDLKRCVSAHTPVAATAWLREHPPTGQVFNTYEWGDYLLWQGPPHLKIFVDSQAHLVPREVWRDYMAVISVMSGWNDNFDRYGVQTIIIDKAERGALIAKLKDDTHWKRRYEDSLAVIFTRQTATTTPEKPHP